MPASEPSRRTSITIDCDDILGRTSQLTLVVRSGRIRLVAPPGQTAVLDADAARLLAEALQDLRLILAITHPDQRPGQTPR